MTIINLKKSTNIVLSSSQTLRRHRVMPKSLHNFRKVKLLCRAAYSNTRTPESIMLFSQDRKVAWAQTGDVHERFPCRFAGGSARITSHIPHLPIIIGSVPEGNEAAVSARRRVEGGNLEFVEEREEGRSGGEPEEAIGGDGRARMSFHDLGMRVQGGYKV